MSIRPPIPMTQILFKISPWKSKVKVIAEGHMVRITPYRLISLLFDVDEPFKPLHSFIQLFKNLILKIQGEGHGWGERWKSQHGSNILSTHTSFIPRQLAIPFLRYNFFKIWPWKSMVKVMVRWTLTVTIWVQHPIDSNPFCSMSMDPSIPEIQNFLNSTFKIEAEGEMTIMLHNYRSRQFHITSNGIHPSRSFRDMASTKSGPSAASFDNFGP